MAETIDLKEKISRLAQVGFLDVDIDPTLDLFAELEKLKKEQNAIFVDHYYQDADIQDIIYYIHNRLQLEKNNKTKK